MSSLSVIIITKNEADNILSCLDSVKFANEIIVLDSGSTDETVSLCQQYTDNVHQVDWPGFGIQKNRALQKCTSAWVLAIDADEIVSSALRQEITTLIKNESLHSAYRIPRKSKYCNQFMAFGDWRKDSCVRLFKKDKAIFKELPVHEALIVDGTVGKLQGPLLHNSFSNFEEVLHKINDYSTLSATYKFAEGKRSGLLKAIVRGGWTFFRGYFLRLGFLDGRKGFMLAISNAEGCYYRYLKIMLLHDELSSADNSKSS
ncbi:MAG: glycosyltransferase family 2 protein [Gammaproteobacteria bacterium]|nr:glycosyltransferase family 2 protein [Gammaproteobacteria bacterium]